jgi:hypothetical protein
MCSELDRMRQGAVVVCWRYFPRIYERKKARSQTMNTVRAAALSVAAHTYTLLYTYIMLYYRYYICVIYTYA